MKYEPFLIFLAMLAVFAFGLVLGKGIQNIDYNINCQALGKQWKYIDRIGTPSIMICGDGQGHLKRIE